MFRFSLQILSETFLKSFWNISETFLILRRNERDVTKREYWFHCFTVHFNSLNFTHKLMYFYIRVIHKSLRNFRPLRYSSRDGHAEGEHVNKGRDTPSFCPTLQVLDMFTSEGSWQTFLSHARQSRPMAPAGLFVSQRTGSHSGGISCTTHELFCP